MAFWRPAIIAGPGAAYLVAKGRLPRCEVDTNLTVSAANGPKCEVDTNLTVSAANGLTPVVANEVLERLERFGVCHIEQLIDLEVLRACIAASMPPGCGAVSLSNGFRESTAGRFHKVCFDDDVTAVLRKPAIAFESVLSRFFEGLEYKQTQFQFLVSEPGSEDQFFHQDNSRRGLTILVPLVNVPRVRGPTELLPGTHLLTSAEAPPGSPVAEAWENRKIVKDAMKGLCGRVSPELILGDAIVYDSRLLHRGLANEDIEPRPGLVYQFNIEGCPPPGHGMWSTMVFRLLGRALA